jgi:pimeloyl-ACP methyl ester carboxylesterase
VPCRVDPLATREDKMRTMIHALPGMGADRRMYPPPWGSIPAFEAHDWVRYSGERSLADVARSMCEACDIRDGDTLVGSSLGGMVACEITKLRQISKLFLVGSAVKKEEISSLLAALRPLATVAPIDWIKLSAKRAPMELIQMFSGIETAFVRAMCEAVFAWDGLGESEVPLVRLHGNRDLVIPPPPQVDLLLNGGHLISMSHARECAAFVRSHLGL